MSESARKPLLLAIAVVALGAAAYLFFRSSQEGKLPDTYSIDGVCLKCEHSGRFSFRSSENVPRACPECGERAVYEWAYCYECKKRFVPSLVQRDDGPPMPVMVPTCPGCGSRRCGAYIPEDPDQQPVGDLALPKMP